MRLESRIISAIFVIAVQHTACLAATSSTPIAPLQPGPIGPSKAKPATKPKESKPKPTLTPEQTNAAIAELRRHRLLMPIAGVSPEKIRGSFFEKRGTEIHAAADMLAPRNTPIVAVENGTIGKLWLSKAGGITIYQFDPSQKYIYYYAHLESYAPGLKDGDKVQRGQVLGFVGTSGDAPPDTPHLHFSISVATEPGRWWSGAQIDPYEVFRIGPSRDPALSNKTKLYSI